MQVSSISSSPQRARAEENFSFATINLQETLQTDTCARLEKIGFPKLDLLGNVETEANALKEMSEMLLEGRKDSVRIKKIVDITLDWFKASYPFAALFVTVAKKGTVV